MMQRGMLRLRARMQVQRAVAAAGVVPTRALHVGILADANNTNRQRQNLRTAGGVQGLPLTTPVFQVFGANTDVGKTIAAAGLCRAIVRTNEHAGYIKPLQTGTDDNCDDAAFIQRHIGCKTPLLDCSTLFSWKTSVSPHLAAAKEGNDVTDEELVAALSQRIKQVDESPSPYGLVLVETAGGVCSPSASMQFQADAYRRLRLPAVLVGDGKLGGISTTISSLESLLLRGYDVAAICLIEQEGLDNAQAIRPKTSELNIPVFTLNAIPPLEVPLMDWYAHHDAVFDSMAQHLKQFHQQRLQKLENMRARAAKVFWWPFTQHKIAGDVNVIDSAHGDEFCTFSKDSTRLEPMFDACASWWTQGVGHGNGKMATALAHVAGRYGHVMFPENAHEPAFNLSERLLSSVGKNWASRVFFSDDGSTAVEVGVKMAFRKYMADHGLDYEAFAQSASSPTANPSNKLVVLAQSNCYHGDTLGVMNLAEPSVFNARQHPWYRAESVFLKTPSVGVRDGRVSIFLDPEISPNTEAKETLRHINDVFDLEHRDPELAETYRQYVQRVIASSKTSTTSIGALLIEPILLGSGGMVLVDPLFQRVAAEECRAHGIPVIFDEVFSGWWRLGVQSGRELLGVAPDVACYAKLLTGGVVPMAVTLASEDVFTAFYADTKGDALLHGHSFTAHPVGCAAALTAMDMLEIFASQTSDKNSSNKTKPRAYWDDALVTQLSRMPHVARTLHIGTVVCVELASSSGGYASMEAQELILALRAHHVYARALGNVVYMMCSPLTPPDDCQRLLGVLQQQLEAIGH